MSDMSTGHRWHIGRDRRDRCSDTRWWTSFQQNSVQLQGCLFSREQKLTHHRTGDTVVGIVTENTPDEWPSGPRILRFPLLALARTIGGRLEIEQFILGLVVSVGTPPLAQRKGRGAQFASTFRQSPIQERDHLCEIEPCVLLLLAPEAPMSIDSHAIRSQLQLDQSRHTFWLISLLRFCWKLGIEKDSSGR